MTERATKVQSAGLLIPAIQVDELSRDDLCDAEEQWCLARVQLLRKLNRWPLPEGAQSIFWNWSKNALILEPDRLGPFGDVRIFGLRVEQSWEGLLCGVCENHYTRIAPEQQPLVYVELLEIAPWNWKIGGSSVAPRYRGIGPQLMEMAISWSIMLGYKGRLGLHALPQAEAFYRDKCRMQDLGKDPSYNDFSYFEFTAEQAENFLKVKR